MIWPFVFIAIIAVFNGASALNTDPDNTERVKLASGLSAFCSALIVLIALMAMGYAQSHYRYIE